MTAAKRFEMFFFTLVLFLLTDKFSHFINFLSRQPNIRQTVNFLTDIPLNQVGRAFRLWAGTAVSFSLDAAFWFVLLMLFVRPGLVARVYGVFRNNAAVAALLILAGASWFWSIAPDMTLNGMYLILKITVVGIYISQAYSSEEVLDLFIGVVALAGIFSILAVWQIPEQGISGRYWQGIYSFKNFMGRLMAFGNAMLVIYWFKNSGAVFKRIFALGLFVLTGVLLVYSDSATSLLALLGMYAALILFGAWKQWGAYLNARMRWLLILIGSVSVILAAWNYEDIFLLFKRSPSLSGRTELWQILWEWFQKRPIFGFGHDAFWRLFPDGVLSSYGQALRHAHNGYLEVTLGLGLFGLTVFLLALIIAWKRAITALKQNDGIVLFWPILALMYFTLANATYSIAFENPDFHWLLFIVVAGLVTPVESKTPVHPSPAAPMAEKT